MKLFNSEMETIIMMKCKPFEMRNEYHYNRDIPAIIIGTWKPKSQTKTILMMKCKPFEKWNEDHNKQL